LNEKPSKNIYLKKRNFECYQGFLNIPEEIMTILEKYFDFQKYLKYSEGYRYMANDFKKKYNIDILRNP
jgi:hypothetical protein